MNDLFTRLVPVAALCLPLLATAQSGRADPADAKASAPALTYRSAFADYKPWQNLEPGNWRALNDRLAPAAKASAPAASAPHGQGAHGGKR